MIPDARLWDKLKEQGLATGARPPERKKRSNEEGKMQREVIKWWCMASRGFGVPEILLLSIPNGGGGGEMRGHWLKMEGCRKGAPDLMLCVAGGGIVMDHAKKEAFFRGNYHALFLELKTPTGRLSPEQEVYHGHLRAAGYRVEVVRTFEECVATITSYLRP